MSEARGALPPGTWWIEEPWLAGGANPTVEALKTLETLGFAAIVSLLDPRTESPAAVMAASGFDRRAIPIADFTAPTLAQCEDFVRLLDAFERRGSRVLVHCQGGKGRTGTMAAVFLVARGCAADEAIARVRRARQGAIETPEQEAAIHDFARGLCCARPTDGRRSRP